MTAIEPTMANLNTKLCMTPESMLFNVTKIMFLIKDKFSSKKFFFKNNINLYYFFEENL